MLSVYLVGLDARGFLIAPLIAAEYNKAFVPIRKAGKLPGETIQTESIKEYGKVCFMYLFVSRELSGTNIQFFVLVV